MDGTEERARGLQFPRPRLWSFAAETKKLADS
jgi:hypothetical protein